MHTFLLDLWHDLRAKRLWPVAALMLVATAAVPFVLLEKEEPVPPPATPPTQARTASDKLPTIALDDVSAKGGSNLTEFSQRNPFKPLSDLPKAPKSSGSGENQTVDLGDSPDSGGSSKGGSSDADVSSSSSGGGKSSGEAAGGSAGGGGAAGGGSTGPRTIYYDYRTDILFGKAGGKQKAMKQVAAFTLLGDDKEPAAMFMGVTDDHEWAVFTVDTARYEAQGEHECKPSPERCEFVYLKVDGDANDTTFTSLDGEVSYDLTLTAIKRIILDKSSVEDVPTENESDKAASEKRSTVDSEPRSLFDIFAKRR